MDFLIQPWPWYIGGPAIALVLFLLFYFGRSFGVSSNLETLCTIAGAGKVSNYFKKDWKQRTWGLLFILGLIIGGFVASTYFSTNTIDLNPKTINDLNDLGFLNAGKTSIAPMEIFSIDAMLSLKGFLILLLAGICIGFGSRYAGGCTSGHAITGLSNLQLPSLIAVIGFFTGGLLMTWLILPYFF